MILNLYLKEVGIEEKIYSGGENVCYWLMDWIALFSRNIFTVCCQLFPLTDYNWVLVFVKFSVKHA